MHEGEIVADELLVRRLLREQMPQWAELPLARVPASGTDHVIYRLGKNLCVRMPRIDWAIRQAAKEAEWLPRLAPGLSLAVPVPRVLGVPGEHYPWPWSVCDWIEAEDATRAPPNDLSEAADALAAFIQSLQAQPSTGAPDARELGLRGAPLSTRDCATRNAIARISERIDAEAALRIWDQALQAPEWSNPPVWHHGDLLPGNLLVRGGRLCAVIDFGGLGVGDPACDLIGAWTLFDDANLRRFRGAVDADDSLWARARGHAISQAAVYIPYYQNTNPRGVALALKQIDAVIAERDRDS